MAKLHGVLLPVAPDAQLQQRGERVDDRDADAVQPPGNLIDVLIELTAGMQLGHDDLGGGDAFLGMDSGRDAAAIVGDRAGAVRIERDRHFRRVAGERLVDGVVDDLINHVMEAGTVIGVPDIHAGALANRIQAPENLDGFGVVLDRGERRVARLAKRLGGRRRRVVHHVSGEWQGC